MKKFWKNANGRLKFGLIVTAFFLILGFVVYYIPHADPFPNNIRSKNLAPSIEHFLGTTSQGQDIFWLLIEAIHNSLMIGFIVAFLGTVVGVREGTLICASTIGLIIGLFFHIFPYWDKLFAAVGHRSSTEKEDDFD